MSKEMARQMLGIPRSGRLIVAAGGHAIPRKGTGLLIDAFAQARLADDDRLLLVGELGDSIRHVLSTTHTGLCRSGRILTIDTYVDDAQLMASLSAADLVCTPYHGHWGSSGIVLRAAQVERPVLAPDVGWLGDMVPKFKLGATVSISDAPSLAAALVRTLAQFPWLPDCPARDRLVKYGTPENFARAWSMRVRTRLGLGPDPSRLTWEWVETGGPN
jgi:glycosyltransferase involved in cell wall biosynthesis